MVRVQTSDFDAATLTAALRQAAAGQAGAVVCFTGYVRDYLEDSATASLFLEHYPGMCEQEIERLCEQARARWPIQAVSVVHRVGELTHGEQIVYVGVASAHRGDAFRACEYVIDALKTTAPFWKRETLRDGSAFWVAQRDSDARQTARWDDAAD